MRDKASEVGCAYRFGGERVGDGEEELGIVAGGRGIGGDAGGKGAEVHSVHVYEMQKPGLGAGFGRVVEGELLAEVRLIGRGELPYG